MEEFWWFEKELLSGIREKWNVMSATLVLTSWLHFACKFVVPEDYDAFWNLLQGRTPAQVSTILERMIKCNHPSLGGNNDVKANTIFTYLLQVKINLIHSLKGFLKWFLSEVPYSSHLSFTIHGVHSCSTVFDIFSVPRKRTMCS